MIKNTLMAAAAATLAFAPVVAQAQSADAPKVERSAKPVAKKKANEMQGSGSMVLIVAAVAAIIAGIVVAADGGNDDPVSP